MARIFLRVDFDRAGAIGPGKIRLLEQVRESGSISGAARAMRMSYRRAWLLIDALNASFREPLVDASTGGRQGGGAALTRFGAEVIKRYRDMERAAERAMARHFAALDKVSVRRAGANRLPRRAAPRSSRGR